MFHMKPRTVNRFLAMKKGVIRGIDHGASNSPTFKNGGKKKTGEREEDWF